MAADLPDDLAGQVEPERVEQGFARVNSPACRPSGPRSPDPGRASQANTIGCCSRSSCRCSSYSVSKVPIASWVGISAHKRPHQGGLAGALGARSRRWTCGP